MAGHVTVTHQKTLQTRLVMSSSTSTAVYIYVPFVNCCPCFYRGYTSTAIEKVCDAVKSGKISIRVAAEEYGIPRSTLQNKVSGKVGKLFKSGPKTHLTDVEESKLAEFLVHIRHMLRE